MSASGLRVAVAGATGALGSEVLALLEARRFPVGELVPVASERSAGQEISFLGELYPVVAELPDLSGIDLLFLCTPPRAALELAGRAARTDATTIDLSGALGGSEEVPLLVAGVHAPREALERGLVEAPPGPALAWIRVLAPLGRAFDLERVVGTTFEAASGGGRGGIESLSAETIALFNQRELPEPTVFERPVAFDCIPWVGRVGAEGSTCHEERLARAVRRLVGAELPVAVTAVRVPTFSGDGSVLAIETAAPVEPARALEVLRVSDGVVVWEETPGPTTRATAGRDVVLVGRVRRDASRPGGLLLWLTADAVRLAASNAVRLAEARFRAH